jgi:hypothetical protein
MIVGTWPADDLRRQLVEGAAWWEYYKTVATMWNSDRREAEAEAERRYPCGQLREQDKVFADAIGNWIDQAPMPNGLNGTVGEKAV